MSEKDEKKKKGARKREMSPLMHFFYRIGAKRLAWKLRRFYCPVEKKDLVLEIGSGGNPYFRANVLCDAYLETQHRHFEPLIADRPLVIAEGEKLPFKDNTFDFVIASHVLEHSREPERFVSEMRRVAKAGYIETPDAMMERLCPYTVHSLELTERSGKMLIRKKTGRVHDAELFELFSARAWKTIPAWIHADPFAFHMRYYWSKEHDSKMYEILNPEYVFDWDLPEENQAQKKSYPRPFRDFLLGIMRRIFSQTRRNKSIDLGSLLECPECKNKLIKGKEGYACSGCRKIYPIAAGGVIILSNRSEA